MDRGETNQSEYAYYSRFAYVSKERWISFWHQLDEVIKLKPKRVLEIGIGAGLFKALCSRYGINVTTVDINKRLKPDYVASVLSMPFKADSFDTVVGFQLLEHLEYRSFAPALKEMQRVARSHIVLSLPDSRRVYTYSLSIPHFGHLRIHILRPQLSTPEFVQNEDHYWEINSKYYPLRRILSDVKELGLHLEKTFRVHEFPYHRFFIISTGKTHNT